MSRFTQALADTASRVLFKNSEVTAVTEYGPDFWSIELTGDALRNATWNVGDKVQVRAELSGLTMRTYTPVSWDTTRGSTTLLAYAHGNGPGSAWAQSVTVGTRCQFFGPRSSLKLDDVATPLLFVGDETSFALAGAWRGRHPDAPPVAELFEVTDPDRCGPAIDAMGLSAAELFARTGGSAHLQKLTATLIDLLRDNDDATVCLTGKAQSIAAIRRDLKNAGLAGRASRVKAYWDENRTGLD